MNKKREAVFLCGFMGCGKSTIGRLLADKLGCGFVDMDSYITEKLGMSIPQIFAEKGEDYFRNAETDAISELAGRGGVIACGGGAMLRKNNADIANSVGTVVFIDVPFDTCYERISGDKNRPLVMNNTKEELNLIFASRAPIYKDNSAVTADGSGSPMEIAEKIISVLREEWNR